MSKLTLQELCSHKVAEETVGDTLQRLGTLLMIHGRTTPDLCDWGSWLVDFGDSLNEATQRNQQETERLKSLLVELINCGISYTAENKYYEMQIPIALIEDVQHEINGRP